MWHPKAIRVKLQHITLEAFQASNRQVMGAIKCAGLSGGRCGLSGPDVAITICEIKYSDHPFSIDKDYAKKLIRKIEVLFSE